MQSGFSSLASADQPANQGISLYSLQTATNSISLIAGLIAAVLYGNIGVKVIYQNIFVEIFGAPQLTAKRGKYLFSLSVVVYWALAFVIASAIPQFSNISALVAAVCTFRKFPPVFICMTCILIMLPRLSEFSYTFPPFMMLGYVMQYNAIDGDRPYDVNNPRGSRVDTWKDSSRWYRACRSPSRRQASPFPYSPTLFAHSQKARPLQHLQHRHLTRLPRHRHPRLLRRHQWDHPGFPDEYL
jgi:hypothetical protein